jgi:hypothetical protein
MAILNAIEGLYFYPWHRTVCKYFENMFIFYQ